MEFYTSVLVDKRFVNDFSDFFDKSSQPFADFEIKAESAT